MTTDFTKNGQAWLRCLECGAESQMLKYELKPHYGTPVINTEKSIEQMQAFQTKHALCKPTDRQITLWNKK